jgi:hypothetical protein
MLRKHLIGLLIVLLITGMSYALMGTLPPGSINPASLLAIGLVAGYIIGVNAPGLSGKIGSALHSSRSAENKTLYVGNLPFRTTRYELRELFQPYGKIHSARIVIDRATKKPRGYGFVEMDSKGAEKAVSSLNGHTLAGRNLKVSEANDRE